MKRQVFFSFHYNRDVWRAAQVRNMEKVDESSTFCDNDWEKVKLKKDSEIEKWIDDQLAMRSCIVVLVGNQTSERKWVRYEIQRAYEMGKGIVGIRIEKLKDKEGHQDHAGANPFYTIFTRDGHRLSDHVTLFDSDFSTSSYVYDDIKNHLEELIEDAISKRNTY